MLRSVVVGGYLGGKVCTSHVDNRVIKARMGYIAQQTDFPLAVFRFLRGICTPGAIFLGNWPKISWPEKVQLRCRALRGPLPLLGLRGRCCCCLVGTRMFICTMRGALQAARTNTWGQGQREPGPKAGNEGRDPDLVRVLAAICPSLVALGAPLPPPVAPTGSPYTQDQIAVASSPKK
jgi:hypothetical protein